MATFAGVATLFCFVGLFLACRKRSTSDCEWIGRVWPWGKKRCALGERRGVALGKEGVAFRMVSVDFRSEVAGQQVHGSPHLPSS